MTTLTITLPDFITEDEARLLLAIRLFEEDRVSCGKAAELAGVSKRDFMQELGRRGIPVFNSPPEELKRDLENARRTSEWADRHKHQLPDQSLPFAHHRGMLE